MDSTDFTLTSTEETRAGAMACLEALRAIQNIAEGKVSESSKAGWWHQQDSAVAVMLCAAGNPDGFMAGFIATLAEYVKNELSSVGCYPDGWEKPEAAMTEEEKIASRARFDEEVAAGSKPYEVTEEDREQAYQEASERVKVAIGELSITAERFKRNCARHATKIVPVLVEGHDGYFFEKKAAEKISQSISALSEVIKSGDVVFSSETREQSRHDLAADVFGKYPHIWVGESEMKAIIQRFMNNLAMSEVEAAHV